MKKGISFSYEEKGDYIFRIRQVDTSIAENDSNPYCLVRYKKNTKLYEHPFLSWENFTYAYCEPDEEELDDYLLNHALQDNKKTSLIVITKRKEEVFDTFSNDYNVYAEEADDGFFRIFIARKGCLADYFDKDELEDYYNYRKVRYNKDKFDYLFHSEMIDLLLCKTKYNNLVSYNPRMRMDGKDKIATSYGSTAGLISGLLFGYPIESSISMVEDNAIFFFGNFTK